MGYIYEALQRIEEERKSARSDVSSATQSDFAGANSHGDTLMRALQELDPSPGPALREEPVFEPASFQKINVGNLPESSRLVTITDPAGLGAEKFRVLATRLKNLQQKRSLKRLLITSSIMQEGKSLVSSNLAITLARHALQSVLLIDGDLRKPALAHRFRMANRPGLSEFLSGQEPVEKCIYHVEDLHIDVLPAGIIPDNPLELLQLTRLRGLLDGISPLFDWVVIDSPPLVPVADANVWGRLADGMLLVTRQGVTERKMLEKALKPIDNPSLLGVVFNGSEDSHHHYYYTPKPKTS